MTKIKICDIRNIEDAILCQEADVDFIGVHQIVAPIYPEKIPFLKLLFSYNFSYGKVLVTKEKNIDKLISMLSQFPWDYVQLHFQVSIEWIKTLYERIKIKCLNVGIIPVIEIGKYHIKFINSLRNYADFILFDSSYCGGTGAVAKHNEIKKLCDIDEIKFFVAGGLNSLNVQSIIHEVRPFAVDVQSGVESLKVKHKKDKARLFEFVDTVRNV